MKQKQIFFVLEFPCFFYDTKDVGNLISSSSVFCKSSLYIWEFQVQVLLSLASEILSITLLVCEMSTVVQQFEHSLALPFISSIKEVQSHHNCIFHFFLFFSIIENSAVKFFSYVNNHINILNISCIYNFFTDMEKYFFLNFYLFVALDKQHYPISNLLYSRR